MPKAYASGVVAADADTVWAAIRNFNALPDWHPAIATSHIEDGGPSDAVGCIRNFDLVDDGPTIREKLLCLDDVARTCSYDFQSHPFPVRSYHATLRVTPVTLGNAAFVEWWTLYDCEAGDEEAMQDLFANQVFSGSINCLIERFDG